MQHSHEALDRPGGFERARLLAPLRHRDFRVLWVGMAISLVGDGIFLIAIAWEAYALWNAPAALSVVGIGMTVPTVAFLLVGGVLSDRHDRRLLMLWSDVLRAGAVGCLAVLVFTGSLQLWQLVALVALYGCGTAFFTPAFEAIVPDLLPRSDLAAANSLDQLVRPIALRLLGPLLGGLLVAVGAGLAFAVDAASFGASAVAVLMLRPQEGHEYQARLARRCDARGVRFHPPPRLALGHARRRGRCVPRLPRPERGPPPLHGQERAARLGPRPRPRLRGGGAGAIGAAVLMGQRGHPRRDVTVMYATWTLATLAIAVYGIATAAWQLMLVCLVFNALETAGTIVWATIKQRHVPSRMLGRVSSLDWLISIGLLPISFALTAPVASVIGVRATLVGAGLVGAAITLAALFLPGMRDIEETGSRPGGAVRPLAESTAR